MYKCILKQWQVTDSFVVEADGYSSLRIYVVTGSCYINGNLLISAGEKFELEEEPYVQQSNDIQVRNAGGALSVVILKRYYVRRKD